MNPAQHILIFSLAIYRRVLSPAKAFLFGPSAGCRYWPSCSCYAAEAVELHGAGKGSWLALKRVCRCHPWGGSGPDPVPRPTAESGRPSGSDLSPLPHLTGRHCGLNQS